MSDPDDQPRNVKDLLVEAKDASELMVDLAYAAVFLNDEKLAEEVENLEQRLYGYLRRLRTFAVLAARSPEDAEQMGDVLWIAGAIEKIGDAASDIARVIQARLGIRSDHQFDRLRQAAERISTARLEGAYQRLLHADRSIKLGRTDDVTAIETLVAELTT